MRMKKILKNGLFICVFTILFLVPIGLTWMISKKELSSYQQDETLQFREMGYGEGKSIVRRNYKCYFEINGQITSDTVHTVKIEKENTQSQVQLSEGQEIKSGQILGTYKKADVVIPYNAVIESVEFGEDGEKEVYLRDIDAKELVLKGYVDQKTASELRRYKGKNLKGEGKTRIMVDDISNIVTDEGTAVILKGNFEKKHYGEKISAMKIYTGEEYKGVLSIEKSCIYQANDGSGYMVRVLDDNGNYVKETKVKVGVDMGKYVGITGEEISEGMLCDSGYAKLFESEKENNRNQSAENEGKDE